VSRSDLAVLPLFSRLRDLILGVRGSNLKELEHLRKCPDLKNLEIYQTDLRGEGVRALAALTSLGRLNLNGCDIAEHEIQILRESLPNCEILVSPVPVKNSIQKE
jgi:hypothetical protein